MTTDTDLCNRALLEIGTRSQITSFAEASVEAQTCKLLYTPLRRSLLRAAPWGFARKSLTLSQLGTSTDVPATTPYPWGYKYAYPADCVKLRYLLQTPTTGTTTIAPPVGDLLWGATWQMPSRANRFVIGNDDSATPSVRVILTNVFQAIGVYVKDETNPDLFDDAFAEALIQALAYKLVIPLSGNVGMKQGFQQSAMQAIMEAKASDASEAISTTDHTPDWILARGDISWGPGDVTPIGQWYAPWESLAWGG